MKTIFAFLLIAGSLVAATPSAGGFLNLSSLTKYALPTQNAIEIYDMQQGASVSTIYDKSGNGRDCAITGTPAGNGALPAAANYGWRGLLGLTLLGNAYATCPTNILSGLGNTMTFVTVARYNKTGDWQRVWDCGTSSAGSGTNYATFLLKSGNSGQSTFLTSTTGSDVQTTTGGGTPSGQFDVFMVVWSAANLKLYVNGVLAATTSSPPHPSAMTCVNQYIGKSQYSSDTLMVGDIGLLAVYSDAWSPAQVSAVTKHLTTAFQLRAKYDVSAVSIIQSSTLLPNVAATWEAMTFEPHPIQLGSDVYVYYAGWTSTNVSTAVGAIGCAFGPDLNHLAKCAGNPVVVGQTTVWPKISVSDPAILDLRNATVGTNAFNQCYMYYFGEDVLGFEPPGSSIGVATSSDCKPPWTTSSTKIITCCSGVLAAVQTLWRFSAVYLDGTIYGYFNAGPTSGNERIYRVTATDPMGPFGTPSLVIDVGAPGSYDATKAADPTVFFMNSTVDPVNRVWVIDYSSVKSSTADASAAYAFSPDGITWTKFSGNPTISGNGWRCRTFVDTSGKKHRLCDDVNSVGPIILGDPWQ